MKIEDLAKNAILVAIYVLVISLNPIGFMAIQFRVGEALAVVPFFNRKYVPALIVGGGLANLYSPLGPIDIAVGLLCAIITYTASKYIKNNYINCCVYSITAGILVAAELKYVVQAPFFITVLSVAASTLIITVLATYIINKTNLKKLIENS